MEIIKTSLYPAQLEALKRLWTTYGDNGIRSTQGNVSLLKRLITEEDIDVIEVMREEFNFYQDITSALLGDIMFILLKSQTTF